MVKITQFKNHPVLIEKGLYTVGGEVAGAVALENVTAAIKSASISDGAFTLQLKALCVSAGITVPTYATGVILDVAVRDSGAGGEDDFLVLGYDGNLDYANYPGKVVGVHAAPVNDRWGEKLVILPLNESSLIDVLGVASGGSTLDYVIKLVGWVIGGSAYTYPTRTEANLKVKLVVNHP